MLKDVLIADSLKNYSSEYILKSYHDLKSKYDYKTIRLVYINKKGYWVEYNKKYHEDYNEYYNIISSYDNTINYREKQIEKICQK